MLFHKHKWEEVSRKFNPPISRGFEANWISKDTFIRLTMGVTVIELKCTVCGDLKHMEVIGKT